MENLYRTRAITGSKIQEQTSPAQNPIQHDNRAFNIENGDMKTLDYLDYSGTLAKGALAANGSIKLCPKCNYPYKKDYGAYSPYERNNISKEVQDDDIYEPINPWNDIFSPPEEENFFKSITSS